MGLLGKINAARQVAQGMTPGGLALAVLRVIWPYLLALALIAFAAWWVYSQGYDAAKADDATRMGELQTNLDEATTAKERALTANGNLAASEQAMRNALADAVAENNRLAGQREAALHEAEFAREQANTTFAHWRAREAATLGTPTCKSALVALAKACPVKEF